MIKQVLNTRTGKTNFQRFWELFNDFDLIKNDEDVYPNRIFVFKNKKFIWDFNKENGDLWLSNKYVWSILEDEYDLNYNDIKAFIKCVVEERFRNKEVTPKKHKGLSRIMIEERFKNNITIFSVEEQFKSKEITPISSSIISLFSE